MAFTYDPSTAAGKVRRNIADTVELKADSSRAYIFDDAEIASFLEDSEGGILYASAMALRSRAASLAATAGKLKVLDIETDTTVSVKSLLDAAKALEEQADNDGSFYLAETVNGPMSEMERRIKSAQRGGF